MAEELVEVKVEPYDNDDIEHEEQLKRLKEQQEALLVGATGGAASPATTTTTVKVEDELVIKTEFENKEEENSNLEEPNPLSLVELEGMKVVDEQADIITVNAVDKKSEDERQFMMNCVTVTKPARKRKQTFFQERCAQCQQTFNMRRSYEQHIEFGLCTILENKQRCSVCPLSFSSQVQLDTHLAMHRLNRFFCAKHCGKFFITLDECKLHEYRKHKVRNIMCSICNHKFSSCNALIEHMQSHITLKRFICSYCRDWFTCPMDLAKHWQLFADTCGKLMQHYSNTIVSIESSLAARNDIDNNVCKDNVDEQLVNESPAKRAKIASQERQTALTPNEAYLSLADIQIKEEPETDHEKAEYLQSLLTNATSTNESDTSSVVIKSEPVEPAEIEAEIQIKQEPDFADDDYEMPRAPSPIDAATNPGFKVIPASAVLPLEQQTSSLLPKIPNLRMVRLPGLQTAPPVVPAIKQTAGLKPLQIQNQNIKLAPISLTGYKIFKILPNSKLLRLPSVTLANTTAMTKSNTSPPIVLKLKPAQTVQTATANVNLSYTTTIATNSINTMTVTRVKTEPKPIVVQLPSLATNTSIDADDLKRLVNEAEAAKKSVEVSVPATRKNICKTKQELQMIEKLPQKRALIENWKQQVKQFETPGNENKVEVERLNNSDNKYEAKHEAKNEEKHEAKNEEKHEAKHEANNGTKLEIKLETKHETKHELKPVIKKEKLNESFEILKALQNTLVIKKETALHNGDAEIDHDEDNDDNEDDDEYDNNNLIIDEGEDYANNSNSSFSIQTEHSQPAAAVAEAAQTESSTPPIFYLPVTSDCDPELQAARKTYSHLRYQWRCPRCPRSYAQKHSFCGHLVSAHGLCQEEFAKLIVEVRPNERTKSLEELKNSPKNSTQPHSESETESNATIESSSTQATQKSQSKANKADKKTFASKLTCAKCGRTCSTRTALNDHVLANCSREPQYPCTICPKRFYSASTLNQHMSIHTGALPHKCSYCDKRFRTRGQVTVHHRTHTGERPFECQVCGQRFTHRETLISHLSRHIGMKRYKCYACNQQFACISGLKTHREVRFSSCGKVKLNTRAIGPRVRVIKGNVIFEAQPEINPYLRTEDPQEVLAEIKDNETS